MSEFYMSPLVVDDKDNSEKMSRIWNAALPSKFTATPRFFEYNLQPCQGGIQGGTWMIHAGRPVGFVLASLLPNNQRVTSSDQGWLDALVVEKEFQHRGYGRLLLNWAETYLRHMGCKQVRVGQSLRTFFAGVPYEVETVDFFFKHGYQESDSLCWDVSRDLGDGFSISRRPVPPNAEIRPSTQQDVPALMEFLYREFPGRWRYEIEDFLRIGGRPGDIFILRLEGRVEGFCLLTLPDSVRPLDRYFPNALPRPWGQLGTIGISAHLRSYGWGGLLLQTGLEYLRAKGTRGCVIDWTSLVDFYGKYGFTPYTRYHILTKELE